MRELRSRAPTAPVMLFVYAMIALGLGLSRRSRAVHARRRHRPDEHGVQVLPARLDDVGRRRPRSHSGTCSPSCSHRRRSCAARLSQRFTSCGCRATPSRASRVLFARAGARVPVLRYARAHPRPLRWRDLAPVTTASPSSIRRSHTCGRPDGSQPRRQSYNLRYTRDGINWIRDNVKGSPTIIEAIGPVVPQPGSRVSIYTGPADRRGLGLPPGATACEVQRLRREAPGRHQGLLHHDDVPMRAQRDPAQVRRRVGDRRR